MIDVELFAKIRRLYYGEHWKVGTIAEALNVHRDTIANAISKNRFEKRQGHQKTTVVSPYQGFIKTTLEEYPNLQSTRLFQMLQGRGYRGSIVQLRRYVAKVRPKQKAEAYLRLRTLPGEQAQVDWGSFGKIQIGRAQRMLSCFVMILSYSRAIFARFTVEQNIESLLRCHQRAFNFFKGVPREILYDNMKTVVLERQGEHIRFHPQLLEYAGHYHFAPKPCAPYRGNEKGKVERSIQYLRKSFFEARTFTSIEDVNGQLQEWINTVAHNRIVPGSTESVLDTLREEEPYLLPLPEHPFECEQIKIVSSGKTPYIRFDGNDYSIPHQWIRQPLTVAVSETEIRIIHNSDILARHPRCFDKGAIVEDPSHIAELARQKRAASALRGRDRLRSICPHANEFIGALNLRGESINSHTMKLNKLLDLYGPEELDLVLAEALKRGAISSGSVGYMLDQRMRKRRGHPVLPVILPDHPNVRSIRVVPHNLKSYDDLQISEGGEDDQ